MVTVVAEIMDKKDPKDEIMQAALKLFTDKGYFNTSIADIRQAADVSTGTIYHYFKNKESLADALYQDVLHSMNDSIGEISSKTDNAFERLRAIVELFFTLTENAPEVMRFIVSVRHQEFRADNRPMSLSEPFLRLTSIMQDGIERGELRRMDSKVASACFYGTIARMIQLRLDGGLEKSLDWYLLDTWTAIWKALSP
ncbi:MAG: TetR/AcrR family transcriptional regulator [Methylohalobius sp. ZOD2]|nr:TetR/AcrR family transcriptional regulator [Methylothermaceae bacterium]